MTKARAAKAAAPQGPAAFIPPYPPSWFDRLTDWVDRLPGPPWAFYLLLAIASILEISLVQWLEGAYPPGTFHSEHILIGASLAYFLALMHYLDKASAAAIVSFRPFLTVQKAGASVKEGSAFAEITYRLTTLPKRPALIVTLVGALFAAAGVASDLAGGSVPGYPAGADIQPVPVASVLIVFIPVNVIMVLLLYHTVHQLVQVSRVYTKHARINLYQIRSLYALSLPGAYTALGLIAFVYSLWVVTRPAGPPNAVQIGLTLVMAAIALATFAWPLWGAHRRLVQEKEERLADVSTRFESATHELHRQLDSGRLTNMDGLNKAVATLEIEQNTLRKIPTWPWQPGAIRAVAAALLLPIAVFALETILGRLLGR